MKHLITILIAISLVGFPDAFAKKNRKKKRAEQNVKEEVVSKKVIDHSQPSFDLKKYSTTASATKSLRAKYEEKQKLYFSNLNALRVKAISNSDVDEVKLIENELEGTSDSQFTSYKSKKIQKEFHSNTVTLLRIYKSSLDKSIRDTLKSGKTEVALQIKGEIEVIDEYIDRYSINNSKDVKVSKRFYCEADSAWKKTDFKIPSNVKILVETSGSWTPGLARPKGSKVLAAKDADTYPMRLKVHNNEYTVNKKTELEIIKGGEVFTRMQTRRIDKASGKLSVKLSYIAPKKEFKRVHLQAYMKNLCGSSN